MLRGSRTPTHSVVWGWRGEHGGRPRDSGWIPPSFLSVLLWFLDPVRPLFHLVIFATLIALVIALIHSRVSLNVFNEFFPETDLFFEMFLSFLKSFNRKGN